MKEWALSIENVVEKLVKKFFKVKWSPVLIPFQNGDNKTILNNLEKEFRSVIKLKPDLCTRYIESRDREKE